MLDPTCIQIANDRAKNDRLYCPSPSFWHVVVQLIAIGLWLVALIISGLAGLSAKGEDLPAPDPQSLYRFGTPEGTVYDQGDWCFAFDGRTRLPRWAMEHLTIDTIAGDAERPDDFRTDERIPDEFRPELKDYRNSGFDRFHLVPAADFGREQAKASTFILSNVCPGDATLNRTLWARLESHVTLPVFMPTYREGQLRSDYRMIGPNWVAVPTHFAKSLLLVELHQDGTRYEIATWMAQNAPPHYSTKLADLVQSVDYVERLAGLDLWSGLPDDIEKKLEKKPESQK
jgi:endonuclease G, mitochondrial